MRSALVTVAAVVVKKLSRIALMPSPSAGVSLKWNANSKTEPSCSAGRFSMRPVNAGGDAAAPIFASPRASSSPDEASHTVREYVPEPPSSSATSTVRRSSPASNTSSPSVGT